PRNGCSVQDGYVNNGLCEIREGSWKEPRMDEFNGMDRFMNQQFQEEKLNKLQKLLILLRGLPGSGKTTLSRILLGQSRDGIVFSTDDYFHHQDGYKYNVNQLSDAHDWNQNRGGINMVCLERRLLRCWIVMNIKCPSLL
uniref:NEDD4 binding protein 2 like 2 n=1 Tax=Cavia porcellus TaxID=10141 RepID=A0A286XY37_CAVPO